MNPLCAVADEECVPGRLKVGMCEKHWRRQKYTGTTKSSRIDNFSRYSVDENGCWIWQGPLYSNGYGKTSVPIHGTRLAHRVLFIEHRGEPPVGLDLDHLCHVRACVRPDHLDPVDRSTNLRRGYDSRVLCKSGLHDISDPENVKTFKYGRTCKLCWQKGYREGGQRYRDRLKAEAEARGTH